MKFAWAALTLFASCTVSVAQTRDDGLGLKIPRSGVLSPPNMKEDDADRLDRRAPLPCDGVSATSNHCPFRFSGSTSF